MATFRDFCSQRRMLKVVLLMCLFCTTYYASQYAFLGIQYHPANMYSEIMSGLDTSVDPGEVSPSCCCGGTDNCSQSQTSCHPEPLTHNTKDRKSLLYGLDQNALERRLLDSEPFHFLDDYKNPCWLENLPKDYMDQYGAHRFRRLGRKWTSPLESVYRDRLRTASRPWRMRCLPYFYLAGVTKGGTTDLFESLMLHPDVVEAPWVKEPQYWQRHRAPGGAIVHGHKRESHWTFDQYTQLFDHAAHTINMSLADCSGSPQHQRIIGDGTSYLFWEDNIWKHVPGNEGLDEPTYTVAKTLLAIQPSARILVLLRNPTDRVYSAYSMYAGDDASPSAFHEAVVSAIKAYQTCFQQRGLRQCAYDADLGNKFHPVSLRGSMYAVFLHDWWTAFPRDQVLVVKSEDYYEDKMAVLHQVFTFLGLGYPPRDIVDRLVSMEPVYKREYMPIKEETRLILNEFFKPLNEQLGNLLPNIQWDTQTL